MKKWELCKPEDVFNHLKNGKHVQVRLLDLKEWDDLKLVNGKVME